MEEFIRCDEIKLKISKKAKKGEGKFGFRIIGHSSTEKLTEEDFYPTLFKKFNNTIPSPSDQKKLSVSDFGTSVLESLEDAKMYRLTIPSLRNGVLSKGPILNKRGLVGQTNGKGHFDYYLFDPINNSPCDDFTYVSGE